MVLGAPVLKHFRVGKCKQINLENLENTKFEKLCPETLTKDRPQLHLGLGLLIHHPNIAL